MNKRKDHLDSSGAGSQGQKSPGKAQEEDLSSPEAPSHLGGPGKYHFLCLELHWRVLTSSHMQKLRQESFISLRFDESLVR